MLDTGGGLIKYLGEASSVSGTPSNFSILKNATSSTSHVSGASSTYTPNFKKIQALYGNYPIVYDTQIIKIENNQLGLLPQNIVESIIAWHTALLKKGIGTAEYFKIDNPSAGVMIDTAKTWNIYFNPDIIDVDFQINNLKNILKTVKPTEYIDLRLDSRIYWK